MSNLNIGGVFVVIAGIVCFGMLGIVANQITDTRITGIAIVSLGLLILWGLGIAVSTSTRPTVERCEK